MAMNVNREAVEKARRLIDAHQYDKKSDWSEDQPSPEAENDYIDQHGWDAYGEWHLAIDTGASPETKDRYNFPYGDFRRVHRNGLIAAKQRAAQYDYRSVEQAADELLKRLDEVKRD